MKKVEKLAQIIDKSEFINFYSYNTRTTTAEHFNIKEADVKALSKYLGFKKTKEMIGNSVSNFYQSNKLIAVHIPGDTHFIKVNENELEKFLNDGYVLGYEQSDAMRHQKLLKSKQTKLERYGDENYNNMDKNRNTKFERYGDENYNNQKQIKQTQFELYGGYAFTDREKYEATMISKYGVKHNWASKDDKLNGRYTMYKNAGSKEQHYANTLEKGRQTRLELYGDEFYSNSEQAQQTMLEKYGVPFYTMTSECQYLAHTKESQQKRVETKNKNNSWHHSQPEIDVESILKEEYGEENVIPQYNKDDRYPFSVDFYVKPLDLFIELNLYPTHNTHPFNCNDDEDVKVANLLKANPTDWNNAVIDVWTVRDVTKLNTAIKNKLNYLMLYPNDDYKDIINIIKERNF